jgi:hypothetical protein
MGTDLARYRHPERVIESTNLSLPLTSVWM